ncbi:MAG: DUF4156 domain-containing protein [Polyangiaceae bacterium]
MKKLAALCGSIGLVALAGAGCVTPLEQGRGVEMSGGPPGMSGFDPSNCVQLGFVVGHAGGLGGQWITNDTLIESAMNDLRNQAAELGANFIQYDTPTLGVLEGNSGSNTTTATVSGVAYRCDDRGSPETASDIALAASTDDSPPPQKSEKPPPKQTKRAERAKTPSSDAEEGCKPKSPRACVGKDNCAGAQVCQDDGKAFAPCDCNLGLMQ